MLAHETSFHILTVFAMTHRIYTATPMASCQHQRLINLHPGPMICFPRHAWHPTNSSILRKASKIIDSRCSAASGSLDEQNDFFDELPPLPPPSDPATQEPKDDILKFIYHVGKFIRYVSYYVIL